MTREQISKLKCTRKQVSCKYWVNVFQHGHKVIAEIWEPNEFTRYKFNVSVPIGCNYSYVGNYDTFPEAVEKMGDFLESIHFK